MPLTEILKAVSGELAVLAELTAKVEATLSPCIPTLSSQQPDVIQHMQGLDQIRQGLEDLSILTRELQGVCGETAAQSDTIKVIRDELTLNTTQALLTPHNRASRHSSHSSDVDLF